MTNIKNSSGQRGVALLFALGILSLLLVMGVAFLGNALISQKIAINNQESASAKMLGQTAVDRALSHLTMFHLIQVRSAGDFYASDGSSVYSRLSSDAFDGNLLTVKRDRIYTQNAPLFSISRGQEGNKKWYDGSESLAQWIYVHEDGKFSNGSSGGAKIVGRFAYQVLPQTSASRLSLFAVTSGASRVAGEDLNTAATARIPQKHRWGLDVDELVIPNTMFSTYWKHDSGELCDPLHEFDNFINVLSGNKSNANHFYGDTPLTESRKRWLEHIFAEGRGRVVREAYWGGDGWYPRFNLGRFNYYWDGTKRVPVQTKTVTVAGKSVDATWYQRFLELTSPPTNAATENAAIDNIRNKKEIIDFLLKAPGKYTDSFLYDGQYEVLGLPFLCRIGNEGERGSFDKVEELRRQIAANLNDYCDNDSVPTSDVSAKDWIKDDVLDGSGTLPTYTGNEKTPYINELALGLRLQDAKFNGAKFEANVDAEFIAELIKVYDKIFKDWSDLNNFKLYSYLKHLKMTFEVSVTGTASVSYDKGDGTSESVTVTLNNLSNKKDEAYTGGEVEISQFKNKKIEIGFTDAAGSGPYWVKNLQSNVLGADKNSIGIDFSEEIKALDSSLSGKTVNSISVNPTNVRIRVVKVSLDMGNWALAVNDASETDPAYGVDFVKPNTPDGGFELTVDKEIVNASSIADLASNTANDKCIHHLGVMQAIDPRQNLNARVQNGVELNVKGSDWYFSVEPAMTLKENGSWDTLSSRVDGKINKYSAPNAPCYANATGTGTIPDTLRDKETATDPAWQGDAADKHISTAVIRNAPMLSPWELGFIHRGIPFQTINLLRAGGIGNNGESASGTVLGDNDHAPGNFNNDTQAGGTSYADGDAGILDQIKMTDLTKSYGKVDISALQAPPVNWLSDGDSFDSLKLELFKSLFENLFPDGNTYQAIHFVDKVYDRDKAPDFSGVIAISGQTLTIEDSCFSSAATTLRSKALANNDELHAKFAVKDTDAAREEVIGKTINLIEGRGSSLPNVFKVVIAAQAIRDLDGSITKLDKDGQPQTKADASFGIFDATIQGKSGATGSDLDSSIYYDEILGECRMLVTIEKLHYFDVDNVPRARLRVKQVEYLD